MSSCPLCCPPPHSEGEVVSVGQGRTGTLHHWDWGDFSPPFKSKAGAWCGCGRWQGSSGRGSQPSLVILLAPPQGLPWAPCWPPAPLQEGQGTVAASHDTLGPWQEAAPAPRSTACCRALTPVPVPKTLHPQPAQSCPPS